MLCSFPVQRHSAAGGRGSVTCAAMERVCENCAREDDDLALVHRLYIVPEDWDTAGSITKVEETELWCFSCRSMYPNQLTED